MMNETEIKAAKEALHMLQVRILGQKLEKIQKDLQRIQIKKAELEAELRKEERAILVLREQILAEKVVPADILALRQEIIGKIERTRDKTITILEKERLETEIGVLKPKLQEMCQHHRFVLSYDGYEGSYVRDYSDAQRGERVCVVCGFVDDEDRCARENYKILCRTEERLVKRDLRNLPFRERRAIWRPLKEYLEMFYQSAGCMNACWPKAETAVTSVPLKR